MWIDGHSVRFTFGVHSQVAKCADHGPYLKDLREGAAEIIVRECTGHEKVCSFSLFDRPGRAAGQPDVFLFNPEGHEPSAVAKHIDVLAFGGSGPQIVEGGIGVEAVEIDGNVYWVPYYYDVKLGFVRHCPKCPARTDSSEMTLETWHAALRASADERLEDLLNEIERDA